MSAISTVGGGNGGTPDIHDCYETTCLREWGQFLAGVRPVPAVAPYAVGAKFMAWLGERGWISARNSNAKRIFEQSISDYCDLDHDSENPLALLGRVADQYGSPALADLIENDKYVGVTYDRILDFFAINPSTFEALDEDEFSDTQLFRNNIYTEVMSRRAFTLGKKYSQLSTQKQQSKFWRVYLDMELPENRTRVSDRAYRHHSVFNLLNIALCDEASEDHKRAARLLVRELLKISKDDTDLRRVLAELIVSGELSIGGDGTINAASRLPHLAAVLDEMTRFHASTQTVADYPGALMKMVPKVANAQDPIRLLDDTTAPDPADTLH